MKHKEIVEKMSLEQKAAFVSGYDYWHLEEAPELGLPKIMITDGPHGLRKANPDKKSSTGGIGLGNSVPATCFPPCGYVVLLLGPGAFGARGRGNGRRVP